MNVSCWTNGANPGFSDRITAVCGWVPNSAEQLQPFLDSGAARQLPGELAAAAGVEWEVAIGPLHQVSTGS